MKLYELFEARRNPEQNPRESVVDILRKYKDDPNIFISFKGIPKMGMNPAYSYNTPMGVYFYPLQAFWKKFEAVLDRGILPNHFATDYRYCFVARYNGKGKREIRDTAAYTNADRMRDFDVLRKLGYDVDDAFSRIPRNQYTQSEFGKFWNTVNILTAHVSGKGSLGTNLLALEKNKILRKLGYAYISEPAGTGIIHPSEVEQGFFTSGAYIKTINMVDTMMAHGRGDNYKIYKAIEQQLAPDTQIKNAISDLFTIEANQNYSVLTVSNGKISFKILCDDVKGYSVELPKSKTIKVEPNGNINTIITAVISFVASVYSLSIVPVVIKELANVMSTDECKIELVTSGANNSYVTWCRVNINGTVGSLEISKVDANRIRLYPYDGFDKHIQPRVVYISGSPSSYESLVPELLILFKDILYKLMFNIVSNPTKNPFFRKIHDVMTEVEYSYNLDNLYSADYRILTYKYNKDHNAINLYTTLSSNTKLIAILEEDGDDLLIYTPDHKLYHTFEEFADYDEQDAADYLLSDVLEDLLSQ